MANSKQEALLASIRQQAPTSAPVEVSTPEKEEPRTRRKIAQRSGTTIAKGGRVGEPVQFWMHAEDRQLVRELAAWLAGQGLRTTDSLVIRSALRATRTGGELLTAYRKAAELDGRLKQHKTK